MTTATCCPDSKSPETHQYHPLSSGWAFLTRKWKGSPLSEEIRSEKVCVVVCPGFDLNILIKTHPTMDSIVVYGDGNVAFFQALLLSAVPKKTMQSVFW